MVQHGDFSIQLVEAETKNPFPEHTKDGKTFVEVEPGVEYFISIQKTGTTFQGVSKCYFFVDNQDLGSHVSYPSHKIHSSPRYRGLRSYQHGVSTHKALKFTKPRISSTGTATSSLVMGKVEVKIYEGIYQGSRQHLGHRDTPSFQSVSVNGVDAKVASKKKNLRSEQGTTTVSKQVSTKTTIHTTGRHLDTIVLHYCSPVGLIDAGVLPKPGMWEHHRMKRPADETKSESIVEAKKIRSNVELFDLSELPSDPEEA